MRTTPLLLAVCALLPSLGCVGLLGNDDTLSSVPARQHDPEIDALMPTVPDSYAQLHPSNEPRIIFHANAGWDLERHPISGMILRRSATVVVGFRSAGACGVELMSLQAENLGDGWTEPTLTEAWERDPDGTHRSIYLHRATPCADLDTAVANAKTENLPGVWTAE